MNYFDYIDSIKPENDLYENTKFKIKSEMKNNNISYSHSKKTFNALVACFILVIVSLSVYRFNSKGNIKHQENIFDTKSTTTSYNDNNELLINTDESNKKHGPQRLIINNKIYLQYCKKGNKFSFGEDNGDISIKKSELGDIILKINTEHIIDTNEMFICENADTAIKNKFYNSTVYEYLKCKNNTVYIVKTLNDYYLFYLNGVTTKSSSKEILDIYSSSNTVEKIEAIKNDEIISEIQDSKAIYSIIQIIENNKTNYNLNEVINKKLLTNEENDNEYLIKITYSDSTKLYINLYQNYFTFNLNFKDDYGYYLLDNNNYQKLKSLFKTK